MAARRLLVVPTGRCKTAQSRTRLGGSPDVEVAIPLPMYAIETDDGWVIFDTGCDPRVIDDIEGVWGRLASAFDIEMTAADHPLARLAENGIPLEDVRHVVVSHLHMDHAGGVRFFPDAEIHLQRAEMRWAYQPDRLGAAGFLRSDFDHPELNYVLHEGDAQIVPGVNVVLTDGHTPGHQSLVADLPSGRYVFTGDAAYERRQIDRRVPPPVTTDQFAAVRSLARLAAFEERDGATIFVNHDPEQWESMRIAPEGEYT